MGFLLHSVFFMNNLGEETERDHDLLCLGQKKEKNNRGAGERGEHKIVGKKEEINAKKGQNQKQIIYCQNIYGMKETC